jgi:hypothetical protein
MRNPFDGYLFKKMIDYKIDTLIDNNDMGPICSIHFPLITLWSIVTAHHM